MIDTTRTIPRLIATLFVALFVSSCGGIQNSINPAGPNAENISRIWWLMFIVCSIVFVLVMIVLLLALRKRTIEAADRVPVLEPSEESERRRRNVVISATTITIIILFVFLIASYSSGRSLRLNDPTKNGLSIELTGHQWWWEVRYQDVDASNIFTTANEIHIPVGVPVMFSLAGVPGHLYKQTLTHGLSWLRTTITGDADAAFTHECHLRFFRGFFRQRRRQSAQT